MKCNKVATHFALLVDLGIHLSSEAQCVSHHYPRWTATPVLGDLLFSNCLVTIYTITWGFFFSSKCIAEEDLCIIEGKVTNHTNYFLRVSVIILDKVRIISGLRYTKRSNVLSCCHTKRCRAHPSFGMTPTFPKNKKSKKPVLLLV